MEPRNCFSNAAVPEIMVFSDGKAQEDRSACAWLGAYYLKPPVAFLFAEAVVFESTFHEVRSWICACAL